MKILLKSTISSMMPIFSMMLCLLLQVSSLAQPATFTTIDAPGAGTGVEQGTIASSINAKGEITGFYDAGLGYHGFVRAHNGTITTFDAPGAGTGLIPEGTVAYSINSAGAITGYFQVRELCEPRLPADPITTRVARSDHRSTR